TENAGEHTFTNRPVKAPVGSAVLFHPVRHPLCPWPDPSSMARVDACDRGQRLGATNSATSARQGTSGPRLYWASASALEIAHLWPTGALTLERRWAAPIRGKVCFVSRTDSVRIE